MSMWSGIFGPWRNPLNWPSNIKMFFRCIKWGWQRANRGYADVDVWGFDGYLSKVIVGGLRQLAASHYSTPIEFAPIDNEDPDDWGAWLLETADMFECADGLEQVWMIEDMEGRYAEAKELRRKGLMRLLDHWGDLWD